MRILFQGDSITDVGRSYEDDIVRGRGYPLLVSATLEFEEPQKYTFFNRGISGNRIVDLYARMKRDILYLKPDVMSILIGVNDEWHEHSELGANGVEPDKYYKIYCMLIEEVKEALPDIKIMIMEPFCLRGYGNDAYFEEFQKGVRERAEKAKMVAEKYGLTFIPLQEKFDEAVKLAPNDYWLQDGVHPMPAGHELIKREWLKAFKTL